MDKETGDRRGIAFITFRSVDSARKGLLKQGQELEGRQVLLRFSQPKSNNQNERYSSRDDKKRRRGGGDYDGGGSGGDDRYSRYKVWCELC